MYRSNMSRRSSEAARAYGLYVAAAVAVSATLGILVARYSEWVALYGGGVAAVAVTVVQIVVLRRTTQQSVPFAAVLIVVINLTGILGFYFYPSLASDAQVSVDIPYSPELYASAAQVFTGASACVFFGALLTRSASLQVSLRASAGRIISGSRQQPAKLLVLLAALPAVALVLAYSPAGLLERGHYLAIEGPRFLASMGNIATPVGIGIASLIMFDSERSDSTRLQGGALVVTYTLLLFATGSRGLVFLAPMLLYAYWVVRRPNRPRLAICFAVTVVLGVVLLAVPLGVRSSSDGAGLIPFWTYLVENPNALTPRFGPMLGNILFAVPLTGVIVVDRSLSLDVLTTSLNPLPGGLTDFYEIRGAVLYAYATPFNSLGEAAAYGLVPFCIIFMLVGAAMTWLQARITLLTSAALKQWVLLGGVGASLLVAVNFLQYPLRTSTRTIWYFAAVVLGLTLWERHRARPSRPRNDSTEGTVRRL